VALEATFGPILREDGVEFRLWAPAARKVELVLIDGRSGDGRLFHPLERDENGFYRGFISGRGAGTRYHFRINGELIVPDPASCCQPEDVHGPSEVIDHAEYRWNDALWRGRPWEETVLYELHIGAFTPEGTYRAAIERLDSLVELGVTAIELMPLAECPGQHNWGYDGVLPYAPERAYGRPDELKALVDAAHARGLMAFIDVVYNHFGPEGNYLHAYAPQFFTDRFQTPWGPAIDFAGASSEFVQRYFIENALAWLENFHFDGLRLDAVHEIYDRGIPSFLDRLATTVRRHFLGRRRIHLVLESDDNRSQLLSHHRSPGDPRYDAQWNDDAHHALIVATTGETHHYYADYARDPIGDLLRGLTEGFVYQGEFSIHRQRRRGSPSAALPLTSFVFFAQNHDQIGNRAFGDRLGQNARPSVLTAVAALTMLSPMIPLLFMGEEWNATTPFLFFCDFDEELSKRITEGRRKEFSGFPGFTTEEGRERIPDPACHSTFAASKLKWEERAEPKHASSRALYQKLLTIRRREIMPRLARLPGNAAQSMRLDESTFTITYTLGNESRLHLFAHLDEKRYKFIPPMIGRPLFATDSWNSPVAGPWTVRWSLSNPIG
jgi:malto-oligosyltrehalose trehalohydrolase